mmetsp:Transcript_29355/g.57171  ORF Transcript_29355/g.57171 Transcript_29355/m.57171 type:complete len:234 (-) Transcript_29355:6686-7387(-)
MALREGLRRSFVLLPVFTHDVEGKDVQPQGQNKKRDAQGKGDQRLRRGKVAVAGQLADDLGGDGGHRLERVQRQAGCGPCPKHHDHRLANGTAGRQQDRTHDAWQSGGQNNLFDGFRPRGAQPIRPVAQRLGHRVDDVIGERADKGDQHDTHGDTRRHDRPAPAHPACAIRTKDAHQKRADGQQSKEAIDDCRNTGEDFEQRLGNAAHPGCGIFRQIHGREKANRNRDHQGHD